MVILPQQHVRFTLYEGKYHQVKRMLAVVGNRVESLHRQQIGDLMLDEKLPPGEWRELTEQEQQQLFKAM